MTIYNVVITGYILLGIDVWEGWGGGGGGGGEREGSKRRIDAGKTLSCRGNGWWGK